MTTETPEPRHDNGGPERVHEQEPVAPGGVPVERPDADIVEDDEVDHDAPDDNGAGHREDSSDTQADDE